MVRPIIIFIPISYLINVACNILKGVVEGFALLATALVVVGNPNVGVVGLLFMSIANQCNTCAGSDDFDLHSNSECLARNCRYVRWKCRSANNLFAVM